MRTAVDGHPLAHPHQAVAAASMAAASGRAGAVVGDDDVQGAGVGVELPRWRDEPGRAAATSSTSPGRSASPGVGA